MSEAERAHRRKLWSILTYGPLGVGVVLLIIGRIVPDVRTGPWVGVGLLLMALSCFIYAAMPNSGHLTAEQTVVLRRLGIDYRPTMGRLANGVLGVILSIAAITLLN